MPPWASVSSTRYRPRAIVSTLIALTVLSVPLALAVVLFGRRRSRRAGDPVYQLVGRRQQVFLENRRDAVCVDRRDRPLLEPPRFGERAAAVVRVQLGRDGVAAARELLGERGRKLRLRRNTPPRVPAAASDERGGAEQGDVTSRSTRSHSPRPRRSASSRGKPASRISAWVFSMGYGTRRKLANLRSRSSRSQAARGSPSRGWPTEPGL